MADLKFAIVTCSDTRSIEEDTAGAALESLIVENGWESRYRERRAGRYRGRYRGGM